MGLKHAPPPWKGEIFYQHTNGHGFSEVWWLSANDINTAMDDLISIAAARQAMFDSECRVKFWRVSDSTLKGDTLVKPAQTTTLGTYGTGTPPVTDMMPPEVGLKCRFQHADRYWATRILRMLPEDSIKDGQWDPQAAMTTAFDALKALLPGKVTGLFKPIHEGAPGGDPIVKALQTITPLSITTHRVGRPFGLRRGRSVLR